MSKRPLPEPSDLVLAPRRALVIVEPEAPPRPNASKRPRVVVHMPGTVREIAETIGLAPPGGKVMA